MQNKTTASNDEQSSIYFAYMSFQNNSEYLYFPINPSSLEVNESGQGKTYNVPGIGEINVIGSKALSEISFSGLFPAHDYPFTTKVVKVASDKDKDKIKDIDLAIHPPVYYILLINKWMRAKHPIRFIFSSETYNINTPASIESFTWNEVPGGGGDIEYSIKLKQYVFYRARKIKSIEAGGTARPVEKQQPKTYTMVAGDTLWSIAKKMLGDGTRWVEIQKLNGISDAEIKRLPIGKVLKLP